MNKNDLRDFLSTVENKKYAGVVAFDILQFAIDKGLVERTDMGNFKLTSKGSCFLSKKTDWDDVLTSSNHGS